MNNEINQTIKERLEKLPPHISAAINNHPWMEKVEEISSTHNLTKDQKDAFFVECAILILAMESPQKFPENLSKIIGTDGQKRKNILDDIDKLILTPIMDKINDSGGSLPQANSQMGKTETDNLKSLDQEPPPARPQLANLPNYSDYEKGNDPYREPLE